MKGFTRESLEKILPNCNLNSYAFDVELIYLSLKQGFHIIRIPVTWRDLRADMPFLRLVSVLIVSLWHVFLMRYNLVKSTK